MLQISKIALLILLIILTRCDSSTKEEKVIITDYQIWLSDLDKKDVKTQNEVVMITKMFDGGRTVSFKAEKHQDFSLFDYVHRNDSLLYQGVYCPKVSSFELLNDGNKIEIRVFNYDDEYMHDEESFIFWNESYGLIGINNWVWGAFMLVEKDGHKDFIHKTFYDYIINRKRKNIQKKKLDSVKEKANNKN
jgi:hypothetical protein